MDCKTARLLLDYARPHRCELEQEEAGALQGHLDHCPDCHSLADHERQFDERLGRAMRQVEMPSGLREQLLARLEADRGDWYRQRFARGARVAAAAAILLVLGWFGWHLMRDRLQVPIDLGKTVEAFNAGAAVDPRLRAEATFQSLGVEVTLPPHLFNYNLLIPPAALSELPGHPGRRMPLLIFERNGRHAWVYLVKEKNVPDAVGEVEGGSFKVELLPFDEGAYRFLVLHDGDNLDWLRPPEPPAA
jgi:hypothetical protein